MPTPASAEERWRLTIDNAPVGIALVGLDGTFLRVNDALCRILGYTAPELNALTFQRLTHPDDLDADLELLQQLLAGTIPSYRMRKRYLHADGTDIWADLSVSLVREEDGRPMHFVSHVADLSEEIEAAERIEQIHRDLRDKTARLERSNADLEAFAMLASHDLQAPLATIRGYLELLEVEYDATLDDRAKQWIGRAARAADRMSGLVSSLLEYSRTGVAGMDEQVSVGELVGEVRRDLDQLITGSGAVIECNPAAPRVRAQSTRIRQVLQNLIQNTIKYRSPERAPHTVVDVEERTHEWVVSVTDNACGVPEEHRESIFSMFTRVDGTSSGHGIGLAASRQIVERHGGRIWAEENPAGPGSRFCFTLPR